MKITIIHGQNHKGSTYHIAKMLADKLDGEVTEFFCPGISVSFVSGVQTALPKRRSCVPIIRS